MESVFVAGLMMILLLMFPLSSVAPKFMAFAPALFGLVGVMGWFFVYSSPITLPKKTIVFISVVLFVAGLSALWSIDPSFTLERTGKTAAIFVGGCLAVAIALSLNAARLSSWLWLLPVFVGIAMVMNIVELAFDMPLHRLLKGIEPEKQISGAVANRSAFCVVSASFLALVVIWHHEKFAKYRTHIAGLYAALLFVMLFLSEGQSNQLALFVAAAAFFFFPYGCKKAWIALAGAVAFLIVLAPWIVQIAFHNLAAELNGIEWFRNGYAAYRLEIWDFIARYSLDSPWVGYGLEATRHITDFDSQTLYHRSNRILHPHNFALQIWIEFGVLGVTVFSAWLAALFFFCLRQPVIRARLTLASVMVFLSVGSTGYGIWQGWWLGQAMLILSIYILVVRGLGLFDPIKE